MSSGSSDIELHPYFAPLVIQKSELDCAINKAVPVQSCIGARGEGYAWLLMKSGMISQD